MATLLGGAERTFRWQLPGEPEHVPRRHLGAGSPQIAEVDTQALQVMQQRRAVLLDQVAEREASPGCDRFAYTWKTATSSASSATSDHSR